MVKQCCTSDSSLEISLSYSLGVLSDRQKEIEMDGKQRGMGKEKEERGREEKEEEKAREEKGGERRIE
jgi:hypothetical protein